MSERKQKPKEKVKWYYWVIAGVILATIIGVGFVVVPQIADVLDDEFSTKQMTVAEADEALDTYWKVLPHFSIASAWSLNDDMVAFIEPDTGIEYTSGYYSNNVLNAPLWKENGLMPGVALVMRNSNYTMSGVKHVGSVLFCYDWVYTSGAKTPIAGKIVVLCNLVNFDVEKAAVDYTIKYI